MRDDSTCLVSAALALLGVALGGLAACNHGVGQMPDAAPSDRTAEAIDTGAPTDQPVTAEREDALPHDEPRPPAPDAPSSMEDGPPGVAADVPPDVTADAPAPCDGGCRPGVACVAGRCAEQRSCVSSWTSGCGLVEVGGGTFPMGADAACAPAPAMADGRCAHGASPPQRDVTVGPFAMDAHEVTVARFRAFWSAPAAQRAAVRASRIRYPDGQTIDWLGAARLPMRAPPEGADCNWTDAPGTSEREAHPINCADWWTAQEFCVWDGGRLPTEAEWEYAARWRPVARAAPGRLYPWGDEDPSPACNRAQWNLACGGRGGDDGRGTRRVGSFDTGASGGIFDLAGNVDEWTADRDARFGDAPSIDPCVSRAMKENPLCVTSAVAGSNRVVRGGSYRIPADQVEWLRSASRGGLGGTGLPVATGFRCVRTR